MLFPGFPTRCPYFATLLPTHERARQTRPCPLRQDVVTHCKSAAYRRGDFYIYVCSLSNLRGKYSASKQRAWGRAGKNEELEGIVNFYLTKEYSLTCHETHVLVKQWLSGMMQCDGDAEGNMNQRLSILQNMPIFGGIREDILEFILKTADMVTVAAGEYFFHEHDAGNAVFVLEHGRAAVTKAWNGQEYILTELHDGDCFGEMALIDFGPRTASVVALDACTAIQLSCGNILSIYKQDVEQFTMIQMNMGREVSRRLRKMDEQSFYVRVEANELPIRSSLTIAR